MPAPDFTDRILSRWVELHPDVDLAPLQVTGRLARMGQLLARREEAVFGEFGLNRGEVGVLAALRSSGPPHRLSPGRLGKGLMLSSAGVTSRLDRLERRGLLARHPDPDDRRGVTVELSDRGMELVDAAVAATADRDRDLLDALSATEARQLETLLRKVLRVLEPLE
jgi:DNA-binding MarR family transcriptional regulator